MITDPLGPGRLVIIGQGYVGLPIAVRAADAGFRVVGLDTDVARILSLQAASSYVDDVSDGELRRILDSGSFQPTASYSDAVDFDAAIITVPTPLKDSAPDLSFIESSVAHLAPHLRRGATVVLESTTYPGTTEELVVPLLEDGSGLVAGQDFAVGYSPERIDPGNPTWNFANTPKVISGIDTQSLKSVEHLYSQLVDKVVTVSSTREAELTKLLENTFRHVNIALVNEIAIFAKQLGVDVWEAIDAAATKPFGFMRFTPGPGVGGHCLPIDPTYLSWYVERDLRRSFRFVELANDINDHMPDHVASRLTRILNDRCKSVRDSTILLLGLSYKPNTGDIRESPALRIVDLLSELGAVVQAVDTHVTPQLCPSAVTLVDLTEDSLREADVVVLLSDHDDVDYELVASASSCIFDTRHRLSGSGSNVEYI